MSPLFIYAKAKELDGDKNEGTTIRNAMKVMQKHGVCEYDLYPYSDDENVKRCIFPKIEQKHMSNAANHKIKSYAQLYSVTEVKNAIYNENAVVVGLQVFDTFMYALDGFIGKIDGYYHGGHCVSFVGWDDNLERTIDGVKYKGFLKFQNSWGKKWGDNGFGYLAYDLFNHVTADGWFKLLLETWTTIDDIQPNDPVNLNYHKDKWNEKIKLEEDDLRLNIEMVIGNKDVVVNGKKTQIDVAPAIQGGRTLVPIRFISETLGLTVNYDSTTKKINITGDIQQIKNNWRNR